jgi:hypothetical protein
MVVVSSFVAAVGMRALAIFLFRRYTRGIAAAKRESCRPCFGLKSANYKLDIAAALISGGMLTRPLASVEYWIIRFRG